ncbi:MAG TPA: thiamine pyrophosphate-dependent dehydrogenase E1 component subunit alpha [Streptosporangiaceae bacterium]|nr:thiamine pyrophosphate-dependent dehydrogenase E1 component subunit alpha [Streptosporangiaceae bacterium]
MARIRQFEIAAERLQASGILESSLHLSIGQEAVAAGVCDALRRSDLITTTHRGHGHCIAKGGELAPMMGELFAKGGGYCGGKSGSMHIADPASGILGANAIVGAGIPIALGAALAFQQRGTDGVAVAFFGEGAVAEGVFHESLNIAALWALPIVFVCENNGYAEMTPVSVHLASADVAAFGAPYGIPASGVDGNDVLAVRQAAQQAVSAARNGAGPALLEARTYRWRGHYQGDPETYRTREEVEQWRERDPLRRLRAVLPGAADRFDDLDQQAMRLVNTAVDEVRGWPGTEAAALTEHVYATSA